MTLEQFRVLRSVYEAVVVIGDALGSESSSPGLVIPNLCRSLVEASGVFLPRDWVLHPLDFDGFVARNARSLESPAVQRFLTLIAHFETEVAYCAAPGAFRPDAHARGTFLFLFFVDALEAAGARFLIVFERVET